VPLNEPHWWYGSGPSAALIGASLAPASFLFGSVVKNRYRRSPFFKAGIPVICIGNLTAGGTGKTPLSILITGILKDLGERPVYLTRGYGGSLQGPVWVEDTHDAAATGDEPLLLKRTAPVMVSADRAAAAKAIVANDDYAATVIVMDDGLQNPSLAKDLGIAIIDGSRGIGNGRMIPAGPLRASLKFQNELAKLLIINGELSNRAADSLKGLIAREPQRPILTATMVAKGDVTWLKDTRVFAYAGIGYPQRFFESLQSLGATISGTAEFRDHQLPTPAEAAELIRAAKAKHAVLVTTEKDIVRLPISGDPHLMALRAQSQTLPIHFKLSAADTQILTNLLVETLKRRRFRD
jgi:tetraacyldisaccharide 4'-kinase